MIAPICLSKKEIHEGLLKGRTLTQEEWANPAEIEWVDELVKENIATATKWEWSDYFQCKRRYVRKA